MRAEYAAILPTIRAIAREHGYAIGLHGSTERDLDLIAAPWTDNANGDRALVEAIRAAVDGTVYANSYPFKNPHGRLAWIIYLEGAPLPNGHPLYIDLSVMPRMTP
jgi:hypothetical protein